MSTASLLLCSITMCQGGYNQLFPSVCIKTGQYLVNRCMIVCGHTLELEPGSGKKVDCYIVGSRESQKAHLYVQKYVGTLWSLEAVGERRS